MRLRGEFRPAKNGEYYIVFRSPERVDVYHDASLYPEIILRKKRWQPEIGTEYWTVCADYLQSFPVARKCIFNERAQDYASRLLGNCFRTQEEAEAMAEKIRALFKEAQQ